MNYKLILLALVAIFAVSFSQAQESTSLQAVTAENRILAEGSDNNDEEDEENENVIIMEDDETDETT